MQMTAELVKEIGRFFEKSFHVPPERVTLMQASGSGRLNARIYAYGQTYIATRGDNPAENEAFFYLARHFHQQQLPVPKVLHVSGDRMMYIQEDAGAEDLFSRLAPLDDETGQATASAYFLRAIDLLIDLQINGGTGLDYTRCFPGPAYTSQEVVTDLRYFLNSFCIPAGISPKPEQLENEFQDISTLLGHCAHFAFMHRDYQSRNIMISNERWTIIDFQGGRKGPGLYDAVSLLYQSRLRLPASERLSLLEQYCHKHSARTGISPAAYIKDIPFIRLIRLLQVMGAYGKRGLLEKKPHFIQSIGPGIDQLATYLQEFPEFINHYPALKKTMLQIVQNKTEILCSTMS